MSGEKIVSFRGSRKPTKSFEIVSPDEHAAITPEKRKEMRRKARHGHGRPGAFEIMSQFQARRTWF